MGAVCASWGCGDGEKWTDSKTVWVVDFPFLVGSEYRGGGKHQGSWGADPQRKKEHFSDNDGVSSRTSTDAHLCCFL